MQLRFKINKAETKMGQSLFVVGNRSFIGKWDSKLAHKMSTNGKLYPAWESKDTIEVSDPGEILEYKYIINNDKNETIWEDGENRKVTLSGKSGLVTIADECFGKKNKKSNGSGRNA